MFLKYVAAMIVPQRELPTSEGSALNNSTSIGIAVPSGISALATPALVNTMQILV